PVARLPPADDDAVRRALVLDLDPQALAGHVGPTPGLRDHTVETGPLELLEPFVGRLGVACIGGQENRPLDALEELLEPRAALAKGALAKVFLPLCQQVECDKPGRRCLAEHANPGLGRVDPLLERPE